MYMYVHVYIMYMYIHVYAHLGTKVNLHAVNPQKNWHIYNFCKIYDTTHVHVHVHVDNRCSAILLMYVYCYRAYVAVLPYLERCPL